MFGSMFRQRKAEELKRNDELLAREKELELKRIQLMKAKKAETKKRAEIHAKFDQIDDSMIVDDEVIEISAKTSDKTKEVKKNIDF